MTVPADATPEIAAANARSVANLPDEDAADVERGFVAALTPCVVRDADGTVVWDNDSYSFLTDGCPPTVDPSLWRQSRLAARVSSSDLDPGAALGDVRRLTEFADYLDAPDPGFAIVTP